MEKAKSAEFTESLVFIANAIFGENKPKGSSDLASLQAVMGTGKVSVLPNKSEFDKLGDVFDKM